MRTLGSRAGVCWVVCLAWLTWGCPAPPVSPEEDGGEAWEDGGAALPDGSPGVDAAVEYPDAGVRPDAATVTPDAAAGVPDAATTTPDAGAAPRDAGSPPPDAATTTPDAGAAPRDAGSPPQDAATTTPDAGAPVLDAGSALADAGVPAADAGATTRDAGCVTLAQVVAAATASRSEVKLNCDLTLQSTHVVTKRLVLEGAAGSGITVRCNGALLDGDEGTVNAGKDMIEIRSRKVVVDGGSRWVPVEGVTVQGCRVVGSIRIWGMGRNGQGADLLESSRTADHVQRTRDNAPRDIRLEDMVITATGRIPLYLSPGVSRVTLAGSEVTGASDSVAIYLDAESHQNTFVNNNIHTTTVSREVFAVDASSHNVILNNRFASLNHGGIYLYRNCGEGGVTRHTTPNHNVVVNNTFYYANYTGFLPAVYLGERNRLPGTSFCDEDLGNPYGSSVSNLDYARHNVVMQNQVYVRSVEDMIRTGTALLDSLANWPNYVARNETVAQAVTRPAGCFLPTRYDLDFLPHGQETRLVGAQGPGTCGVWRCQDGVLVEAGTCAVSTVPFSCQVTGNDEGCQGVASCPAGTQVLAVTAACDLETGSLAAGALALVDVGEVTVTRQSDTRSDGRCFAGDTLVQAEHAIARGAAGRDVTFGCRERDANGGDCQVRGTLSCL